MVVKMAPCERQKNQQRSRCLAGHAALGHRPPSLTCGLGFCFLRAAAPRDGGQYPAAPTDRRATAAPTQLFFSCHHMSPGPRSGQLSLGSEEPLQVTISLLTPPSRPPQTCPMAHLQLSPGVELLQAVDRLLSVHHGGHRGPLLAEEKERLNWGFKTCYA